MKLVFEYHDQEKTKIRLRAVVDEKGRYVGPYEEYYENGQLKMKATYADLQQIKVDPSKITNDSGRFVGDYVYYYENGKIQEKKHFDENGLLDGKTEKHWHTYGAGWNHTTTGWRSEYATYSHGKLDGDYELYLDRELRDDTYYREKDRNSLYSKCTYKNGKRHGAYEGYLFMVNKDIDETRSYNNDGFWTRCNYENGVLHGDFISFELDGRIREKCTMVNGKIHGLYTALNGGTYGHYEHGIPVGEHIRGYSIERPYQKKTYNEKGELDGEFISYSYNSQTPKEIHEIFYYRNGKMNGPYQLFCRGRVIMEGLYKDDKNDGIWTQYDQDGKITSMEKYENGIFVTDLTEVALQRQAEKEKNKIDWEQNRFEQEVTRFITNHKKNAMIETSRQNEG